MRNLAQIITGGESPGLSPRSPTPKGAKAEDVPDDAKSTWKALTIVVLGVNPPPGRISNQPRSARAEKLWLRLGFLIAGM